MSFVQSLTLDAIYRVGNYNDTFALGHYARVVEAYDRRTGRTVAFKVLRPEHMAYTDEPPWEYRAIANEASLLMKMAGSPSVVQILDCGYLEASDERPVMGEVVSYRADVLGFIRDANVYAERRWRPYLALEVRPRSANLLNLMKPNTAGVRWRLPTEEGIDLALQLAAVLKLAPQQGIVYLDHKLEHVYWTAKSCASSTGTARASSRGPAARQPSYSRPTFTTCAWGFSTRCLPSVSRQGMLASQPASPDAMQKRYADISTLDFGVEPTLSKALQKSYSAARRAVTRASKPSPISWRRRLASLDGIFRIPAEDGLREIRGQIRAGLRKLRAGQEAIHEARDLLMDAAIEYGINEDTEQELRRLLSAINAMLARRVIP
jgi:serine/threonine protein kinase